ncbi:MAG: hypothetical protein Tsb0010_08020 [Parvularculaceae bacterium]
MLLRRIIEHVKAQNWTAVALDFVIVVVGVFVALAVQERAENARDRSDVARMIEAMDGRVEDGLTTMARRIGQQSCNVQRLDELRRLLSQPGLDWPGAALGGGATNRPQIFDRVYSPYLTSYPTDAYERARLGGALEYLSTAEQEFYINFFVSMSKLNRVVEIETDLISEINLLSAPGFLDQEQRFEMMRAISRLDAINGIYWSQAYQSFDQARARGVKLSNELNRYLDESFERDRGRFGDCVVRIEVPDTDLNPDRSDESVESIDGKAGPE